MNQIDVGDFVLIQGVAVDEGEVDPNGFSGIISGATIYFDDNDNETTEVTFDINLPIEWAPGKNEWTFNRDELVLLEQEVV